MIKKLMNEKIKRKRMKVSYDRIKKKRKKEQNKEGKEQMRE